MHRRTKISAAELWGRLSTPAALFCRSACSFLHECNWNISKNMFGVNFLQIWNCYIVKKPSHNLQSMSMSIFSFSYNLGMLTVNPTHNIQFVSRMCFTVCNYVVMTCLSLYFVKLLSLIVNAIKYCCKNVICCLLRLYQNIHANLIDYHQ